MTLFLWAHTQNSLCFNSLLTSSTGLFFKTASLWCAFYFSIMLEINKAYRNVNAKVWNKHTHTKTCSARCESFMCSYMRHGLCIIRLHSITTVTLGVWHSWKIDGGWAGRCPSSCLTKGHINRPTAGGPALYLLRNMKKSWLSTSLVLCARVCVCAHFISGLASQLQVCVLWKSVKSVKVYKSSHIEMKIFFLWLLNFSCY